MSENVELKPCPFCGGENIEFCTCKELEDCANYEKCQSISFGDLQFMFYIIVCNKNKGGCGASSGYYPTKEKAIEAWNRRIKDE